MPFSTKNKERDRFAHYIFHFLPINFLQITNKFDDLLNKFIVILDYIDEWMG